MAYALNEDALLIIVCGYLAKVLPGNLDRDTFLAATEEYIDARAPSLTPLMMVVCLCHLIDQYKDRSDYGSFEEWIQAVSKVLSEGNQTQEPKIDQPVEIRVPLTWRDYGDVSRYLADRASVAHIPVGAPIMRLDASIHLAMVPGSVDVDVLVFNGHSGSYLQALVSDKGRFVAASDSAYSLDRPLAFRYNDTDFLLRLVTEGSETAKGG